MLLHTFKKKRLHFVPSSKCKSWGWRVDECDGRLKLTEMHFKAHSSRVGVARCSVVREQGPPLHRLQCCKSKVVYGCCHLGALQEGELGAGPITGSLMRVQ